MAAMVTGMEKRETFVLSDRHELIKQGMQLEKIEQDLIDLKEIINDGLASQASVERAIGDKIRILEDARLILETRLKTFLWVATLVGGAVGTAVHILLHVVWPVK
jgi:hypothetical protein